MNARAVIACAVLFAGCVATPQYKDPLASLTAVTRKEGPLARQSLRVVISSNTQQALKYLTEYANLSSQWLNTAAASDVDPKSVIDALTQTLAPRFRSIVVVTNASLPRGSPSDLTMIFDARIVLGGFVDGQLVGTVTLWLATPPNQPFRAEIWKLMTDPAARRRGVARALMLEAERLASERGRSLLNLDTAIDGGAAPLYESLGWVFAGEIPGYAYKPHGGLVGTAIYYKRIAGPPRVR